MVSEAGQLVHLIQYHFRFILCCSIYTHTHTHTSHTRVSTINITHSCSFGYKTYFPSPMPMKELTTYMYSAWTYHFLYPVYVCVCSRVCVCLTSESLHGYINSLVSDPLGGCLVQDGGVTLTQHLRQLQVTSRELRT